MIFECNSNWTTSGTFERSTLILLPRPRSHPFHWPDLLSYRIMKLKNLMQDGTVWITSFIHTFYIISSCLISCVHTINYKQILQIMIRNGVQINVNYTWVLVVSNRFILIGARFHRSIVPIETNNLLLNSVEFIHINSVTKRRRK